MLSNNSTDIPLSLYIHLPWCVQKCPYCDFNSHAVRDHLPEEQYIDALIADFNCDVPKILGREISSIFFGGGTPSLFSPRALEKLLLHINGQIKFKEHIEITLEANPGTVDVRYFSGFHQLGINRLSLGIQSFQDDKLKRLGRIHDGQAAVQAYAIAKNAGFKNINIDLMHGLPDQTAADAYFDLHTALQLSPTHLSWYQLTIEPNTIFAHQPPTLPTEEICDDIYSAGQELLAAHHYQHYEVSAYCKTDHECVHNLNYWEFGDYLGIGAGAHSKLTNVEQKKVERFHKIKYPPAYLAQMNQPIKNFIAQQSFCSQQELLFEFMLNALRLMQPISFDLIQARIFLEKNHVLQSTGFMQAHDKNLIRHTKDGLVTTAKGKRYLNDVLALFME